jgi:PiT family inorganic phosphate transporter
MSLVETALAIGLLLSFLIAIALGGNDAASPCGNVVGARVLSTRQALIIFAIFSSIGALTQGHMNMKTIGTGLVPSINLFGAIVIVLTAFTWIMSCNYFGLEISVTHSIIGSIMGYGLAAFGVGGIQWGLIQKVVISWFVSPILAAILAYILFKVLTRLSEKYSTVRRGMSTLIKIALCYSAYAFGSNDIANATGVYVCVTQIVLGSPPEGKVMFLLAVIGSVGVVIGGLWLGPNVIQTVAFKVIKLNIISGTAAEITNALVVHMFITIPYILIGYGLPISTSIANIGALVGVGYASYGSTGINKRTVARLMSTWILSVLVTALVTYMIYSALLPNIGPIIAPN